MREIVSTFVTIVIVFTCYLGYKNYSSYQELEKNYQKLSKIYQELLNEKLNSVPSVPIAFTRLSKEEALETVSLLLGRNVSSLEDSIVPKDETESKSTGFWIEQQKIQVIDKGGKAYEKIVYNIFLEP